MILTTSPLARRNLVIASSSLREVFVKTCFTLLVLFCCAFGSAQVPSCAKNISFAVPEGGQVVPRVPKFADKWAANNRKKYPDVCFSQTPSAGKNYLLVFSSSRSAFNGIYPTVRTNASTSTSPVSGNGTVTDNSGGMWLYTYSGTETTTTTTQTQVNLPYTDTSNTLYVFAYRWNGTLVSDRWRTITTRQGGDAANTAGYNIGAALGAIHLRGRLLGDVVKDVDGDCLHNSGAAFCALQVPTPQLPAATRVPISPPVVEPSTVTQTKAAQLPCDSAVESHIDGDFNGWEGETIYKLDNGEIWQQSTYHYHYGYAYRPEVVIFKSTSGTCHIRVMDDDDEGVDVTRIK